MSRWPRALIFLSLAFALAVLSGFWRPFYGAALAGLEIFAFALIATGAGRLVLSGLRLTDISESQKTLIGATLGLGVLSLAVFALAAVHILRGWSVSLVLASLWILGWTEMRAALASLSANRNLLRERPLAAAGLAALLGLVFLACLIPPHFFDELAYRLALPQAYVHAGGFVQAAGPIAPRLPQNGEMLFTLALFMKSDILAHLFMEFALALCAWWIFEMGKLEAPMACVLVACLLLLSHASAMILSSSASIEALAMLWTSASVLCFLRGREVGKDNPGSRGWLLLSGVFAGLAFGTDYYAGAAAGVLGAALVVRAVAAKRGGFLGAAKDLLAFASAAIAPALPWLIKNRLDCGDPFFPFLTHVFALKNPADPPSARAYFHLLLQNGRVGSFIKDSPLIFPRLHGTLGTPGSLGWPVVLWFLPIGAWFLRKNKFWRGLFWFCAAYAAIWFYAASDPRVLILILPLLCLFAAAGIHGLWRLSGPKSRAVLASATGLLVAGNIFLFSFVEFGVFNAAGAILGAQSRGDFLSSELPYYPCAAYASAHPGQNDKILLVGERRGYYVEPAHESAAIYGANPYVLWANQSKNPADLAAKIKDAGFTRLLLTPNEDGRPEDDADALSALGRENLSGLSRFLTPLFRAPGCAVMALAPEAANAARKTP